LNRTKMVLVKVFAITVNGGFSSTTSCAFLLPWAFLLFCGVMTFALVTDLGSFGACCSCMDSLRTSSPLPVADAGSSWAAAGSFFCRDLNDLLCHYCNSHHGGSCYFGYQILYFGFLFALMQTPSGQMVAAVSSCAIVNNTRNRANSIHQKVVDCQITMFWNPKAFP